MKELKLLPGRAVLKIKERARRLLPRRNHFIGVDIGAREIKVAEVKVTDGRPEVVALRCRPSPPGVWNEQFDEEALVLALKELANPRLRQVITCIGGEKVVSRVVRLPVMSDREVEAAARFEVEKFVPVPVDQLIIRHVRLGGSENGAGTMQNILLLAVPAATVYRYHSIFSRAGLTVTAIDLQAFALWRLFSREAPGTAAIADIGARTSHLVVVRDGAIRFVRLLPVGGDTVTGFLMEAYGIEFAAAEEMKVGGTDAAPGAALAGDLWHGGMVEVGREIKRSLEFCAAEEKVAVQKIILSGGTSKLRGLPEHLQEALGVPVEVGRPQVSLADGVHYDPAYAVAIGLALREVV